MTWEVICGDMRIAVPMLEPGFDACVTDCPYELGFMGKSWDKSGISFQVGTWRAVYEALKPGAHLLAFGGTRTVHRIACAIEDAGFEIRDQIQWLYGSGFPKSLDVSTAIDKAAGAERETLGPRTYADGTVGHWGVGSTYADDTHTSSLKAARATKLDTAPATPEAEAWQGWGTALKPANEPIIVARKPLSESTVAANVLRYGTGAINVDGCRIRIEDGDDIYAKNPHTVNQASNEIYGAFKAGSEYRVPSGRWPSNVILGCACEVEHGEGCAVRLLDEQSGHLHGAGYAQGPQEKWAYDLSETNTYGDGFVRAAGARFGDSGGASRFFYCAKASKEERRGGNHPTVKPVALMRHLVRLVTPPGGRVLDPFAGTFKTGEACVFEGFDFVGIDLDEANCETGRLRLSRASGKPAELPRPKRREKETPLFPGAE
ncbi:MAG TPA: DNA methyltransferase [Pyrinomonadaceae bacterium]|jgi:site-specific DNA-methyltransferase (adenine-specific)